jgi:hypothetical protein
MPCQEHVSKQSLDFYVAKQVPDQTPSGRIGDYND